jgi:hypothetical protein
MTTMRTKVTSQVLFVECAGERAIVDATLVEAHDPDLPIGTPVTFVLRLPSSPALAGVVEATLRGWTESGAAVAIEVHARQHIDRATMTDGIASLRLEVEAAA